MRTVRGPRFPGHGRTTTCPDQAPRRRGRRCLRPSPTRALRASQRDGNPPAPSATCGAWPPSAAGRRSPSGAEFLTRPAPAGRAGVDAGQGGSRPASRWWPRTRPSSRQHGLAREARRSRTGRGGWPDPRPPGSPRRAPGRAGRGGAPPVVAAGEPAWAPGGRGRAAILAPSSARVQLLGESMADERAQAARPES